MRRKQILRSPLFSGYGDTRRLIMKKIFIFLTLFSFPLAVRISRARNTVQSRLQDFVMREENRTQWATTTSGFGGTRTPKGERGAGWLVRWCRQEVLPIIGWISCESMQLTLFTDLFLFLVLWLSPPTSFFFVFFFFQPLLPRKFTSSQESVTHTISFRQYLPSRLFHFTEIPRNVLFSIKYRGNLKNRHFQEIKWPKFKTLTLFYSTKIYFHTISFQLNAEASKKRSFRGKWPCIPFVIPWNSSPSPCVKNTCNFLSLTIFRCFENRTLIIWLPSQ